MFAFNLQRLLKYILYFTTGIFWRGLGGGNSPGGYYTIMKIAWRVRLNFDYDISNRPQHTSFVSLTGPKYPLHYMYL